MATLVAIDYMVIGVLMITSSAVGVYYWFTGGRQKSTEVIKLSLQMVLSLLPRCVI